MVVIKLLLWCILNMIMRIFYLRLEKTTLEVTEDNPSKQVKYISFIFWLNSVLVLIVFIMFFRGFIISHKIIGTLIVIATLIYDILTFSMMLVKLSGDDNKYNDN